MLCGRNKINLCGASAARCSHGLGSRVFRGAGTQSAWVLVKSHDYIRSRRKKKDANLKAGKMKEQSVPFPLPWELRLCLFLRSAQVVKSTCAATNHELQVLGGCSPGAGKRADILSSRTHSARVSWLQGIW